MSVRPLQPESYERLNLAISTSSRQSLPPGGYKFGTHFVAAFIAERIGVSHISGLTWQQSDSR